MSNKWTQADIDAFNAAKKSFEERRTPNSQKSDVLGVGGNKSFALGRMKAGKMNKTESAWAAVLEARKLAGDVLWWEFEPMNLRLADKCFYQVDFLVMVKDGHLECHEVKGGYITDDSVVKFKTAREKFPFRFRMMCLIKGEWIEKY